MARWLRRSGSIVVAAFLACGGGNADGEQCSVNEDCESGVCSLSGKCGRGECSCEGDECGRIQSSCPPNAVCWRSTDPIERDYPVCRLVCDAERSCPAGQHCEDGACAPGPEPLVLTWEAAPQSCALRSPCTFRVRPPEDAAMERYEWTIRQQGEVVSSQSSDVPELVHTYSKVGIYEVSVVAHARDGASGQLTTSTSVCVGAGGSCATGAPCCSGTCTSEGACR